jgi:hypothetical protein
VVDFRDDFDSTYTYNKAVVAVLTKYADQSSTFSAFSQFKKDSMTLNEFKEGCKPNPELSAFSFALEIFLKQSSNLK